MRLTPLLRALRRAIDPTLATLALAVAAAALPLAAAAQDGGDWLVRARALHLSAANRDTTGLDLSIDAKTFPEVDISYFFTPNWAAELILTYPQRQTLSAGPNRIGTLKHLPPTLTLQYHLTGLASVRPYVGAGVNYTRFSAVRFDPAVQAALQPAIERNSLGFAAQVGIDIPVGDGWLLNADLKKLQLRTDVSSFGARVGSFRIDPVLFSLGIGRRF